MVKETKKLLGTHNENQQREKKELEFLFISNNIMWRDVFGNIPQF
jgi:hypothetical protein